MALSIAAVSRPAGFGVGVCAESVEKSRNVEIMLRIISTLKVKLKSEKLKGNVGSQKLKFNGSAFNLSLWTSTFDFNFCLLTFNF
jgi:hypothetical protein